MEAAIHLKLNLRPTGISGRRKAQPMRSFAILTLLALSAASLTANNVDASNILLGAKNTSAGSRTVTFDVGWENSWRVSEGPYN